MINWLIRQGINRGVFGRSRFFATLGVVAAFVRIVGKLAGTGKKTLYTHKIKPGEVVVIRGPQRKPQ